jgi:hypothetical protein
MSLSNPPLPSRSELADGDVPRSLSELLACISVRDDHPYLRMLGLVGTSLTVLSLPADAITAQYDDLAATVLYGPNMIALKC